MIPDIESTTPRIKLSPNGVNPVWNRYSDSCGVVDNLAIKFLKREFDHSIIEIKGLDVSFVNAIRRILIAEVPSLAIETVMVWQNTGLIHDDVLAHRLALVPFNVDPEEINYRGSYFLYVIDAIYRLLLILFIHLYCQWFVLLLKLLTVSSVYNSPCLCLYLRMTYFFILFILIAALYIYICCINKFIRV